MQIEKTWFEIIKRKRKNFGENPAMCLGLCLREKMQGRRSGRRRRRRTDRTFKHVKIRFYWLPGVIYLIIIILEIMTTLIFFFFKKKREARPSLDGLPSNLTRPVWFGLGWVVVSVRFGLSASAFSFGAENVPNFLFFLPLPFLIFFIIALNFFFLLGMLWSMSSHEFVISIQDVF